MKQYDRSLYFVLTAVFALLVAACGFLTPRLPENVTVAITDVTVIDATGTAPQPNRTVLLAGDRIAAIRPAGEVQLPPGVTVVDGRGKYMIPGLWDMHAHTRQAESLPLFVANGVTGVRVMWGVADHHQRRIKGLDGTPSAPRQFIGTPLVDGPVPFWPGSIALTSPTDAARLVAVTARSGAKFIKTYSKLPRDVYFALAGEARRQGVEFSGHVPASVSLIEASDAGQRTFEHLGGWLLQLSSRETELRAEADAQLRELGTAQARSTEQQSRSRELNRNILTSYSEDKARALIQTLQKNRTWLCPTLTVAKVVSTLDDPAWANDPRLAYVPAEMRARWDPKKDFRSSSLTAEDYALHREILARQKQVLGAMHRAGVPILAGSDTPNPYVFQGFGLHDELALLVEVGLSPMESLQAATRGPAEYMNRLDDLGTVETGKLADLVLLDANPLDDIRNTQRIAAVVIGGKVLPRAELDVMLAGVRRIAALPALADRLTPVLEKEGVSAAIALYQRLRQSEPESHDFSAFALRPITSDLTRQKRSEDLLAWAQWLAAAFPEDPAAHELLGDQHAQGGDVGAARAAYARTLELGPGDAGTLYKLDSLTARP